MPRAKEILLRALVRSGLEYATCHRPVRRKIRLKHKSTSLGPCRHSYVLSALLDSCCGNIKLWLYLRSSFAVPAEGLYVITKSNCCKRHTAFWGKMNIGCATFWGLKSEWLDRLRWRWWDLGESHVGDVSGIGGKVGGWLRVVHFELYPGTCLSI